MLVYKSQLLQFKKGVIKLQQMNQLFGKLNAEQQTEQVMIGYLGSMGLLP